MSIFRYFIAKKPYFVKEDNAIKGAKPVSWFSCPNCGNWILSQCGNDYCGYCGQKIKWTDEDWYKGDDN